MLFTLLSVPTAWGQVSGAFMFQQTHTHPRIHALGEATVALRGYAGAASINPATIGRQNLMQLGSDVSADGPLAFRSPWPVGTALGTETWFANPTLDVKRGRWAFAYQYKHFSSGTHELRSGPGELRQFESYDYAHKIAVAYDVTSGFSVGVGLNYLKSQLGSEAEVREVRGEEAGTVNPSGFSFDLGLYYERPFSISPLRVAPSLGWSLADFGRHVEVLGEESPLSTTMRGGLSLVLETESTFLERPVLSLGLHGNVSKLVIRETFVCDEADQSCEREADGPVQALFTTWQPIEICTSTAWHCQEDPSRVTSLSVADQLRQHRGAELSLLGIASLRWGRFYEREANGDRHFSTRGWGLDLFYLALERSWVSEIHDTNRLLEEASFWRLTARVPLGPARDNFWPALWSYLQR